MVEFKTSKVCAKKINFEVVDNVLKSVEFVGGCSGNTKGLAKLAVNRNIDEVIELLEGIQCRGGTSCPDQLAKALIEYKKEN